jgi:hypothetical protein
MSDSLQLTYDGVALDDLGQVSIISQGSQFTPDDFPQKEVRTLHIRIDFWQQTFDGNYNLVEQARTAFLKQNKILKWTSATYVDADGSSVGGVVHLNRPVQVISTDIPENPNAWGTYQQQINIVVRFDAALAGSEDGDGKLQLVFTPEGISTTPITFKNVTTWASEHKTRHYSEMRDEREMTGSTITCGGEFIEYSTDDGADGRMALLVAEAEAYKTAMNCMAGNMTYGDFFDGRVRVEDFRAEVNQAVTGIKWSLAVSYTLWPDEETYAGAEFSVERNTDSEGGDLTLSVSGTIKAATVEIADAKYAALKASLETSEGFAPGNATKETTSKTNIDVDDGAAFLTMSFQLSYRKRASNILSSTLNINSDDDVVSGLISRTYSGSVTASGATDEDAYQAALTKAQALGDGKHPFKVSSKVTRAERQLSATAGMEFVRLEYSYDYKVKGSKLYIESQSEVSGQSFGESTEKVSGFVVARDYAAAVAAYHTYIRDAYTGNVRDESTGQGVHKLDDGADGVTSMFIRFDFSFSLFKAKAAGSYAIKYAMSVEFDYATLRKSTTIEGAYFSDPASMGAAESGTAGNTLDTFLTSLGLGSKIKGRRGTDRERIGSTEDVLAVHFSAEYAAKLTATQQILQCELSEDIVYSGDRVVMQPTCDGASVAQVCGTEPGSRTISGSVTAATEAGAMAWVKLQHALAYCIVGSPGAGAPDEVYESPVRIQRAWEFLPLIVSPKARATDGGVAGTNFTAVRVNFTFSWQFEELAWSE